MKNILAGQIDHLNFKDGEMIRNTRTIRNYWIFFHVLLRLQWFTSYMF
jgi:hypothetical protein